MPGRGSRDGGLVGAEKGRKKGRKEEEGREGEGSSPHRPPEEEWQEVRRAMVRRCGEGRFSGQRFGDKQSLTVILPI